MQELTITKQLLKETEVRQKGIYHDWNQDLSQLEILAIIETTDNKYYQILKKIPREFFYGEK